MSVVAGWQDMSPGTHHPQARVTMLENYLAEHSDSLDPLEIKRLQDHLARATEALSTLDSERERYLEGLPHTD
ncbi:hypothetical protein IPM09_02440 [Candidatus Saccharibacteria bacterium]|nr:MAG: hypothetical protein IPM09_02440 [Candidatus Saccharibacteria bacterium]